MPMRALQPVQTLMWTWKDTKDLVEHSIAFSSDALHVFTGVVILIAAALMMRRSLASWLPWLVVFALACLNEAADLSVEYWPQRGMQYGESVKDLILTMALPTVLLIAARMFPQLWPNTPPPAAKPPD